MLLKAICAIVYVQNYNILFLPLLIYTDILFSVASLAIPFNLFYFTYKIIMSWLHILLKDHFTDKWEMQRSFIYVKVTIFLHFFMKFLLTGQL
jgi:hypothetical protein